MNLNYYAIISQQHLYTLAVSTTVSFLSIFISPREHLRENAYLNKTAETLSKKNATYFPFNPVYWHLIFKNLINQTMFSKIAFHK